MNTQGNKLKLLNQTSWNWYSIGKLVTETIETNSWKPGQTALVEWMSRASEASGLSLNTIGRMLSVYEFINNVAPSEANEEKAERYPFSSLEILQRIHAIEPSQTASLLISIVNKEISMRDLRLKLEMLQSEQPKASSLRRSTSIRNNIEFEKFALLTLQKSLSEFHCPEHYEFAVLSNRRIKEAHEINIIPPDALAWDRDSIDKTSTGFNIYNVGNEKLNLLVHKFRLIAECCYMSSFLSKLFLVLPASADRNVSQDIADTFTRSQRLNIGVVLLRPFKERSPIEDSNTDNFIFLSRPLAGKEPTPDCRTIVNWNSILS
jgi:hypothetical protein